MPGRLPGTEGAIPPEFSPDGRWIAFGAPDGSLKKIAVDGTSLTTLCQSDVGGLAGLTWTSDRELVFTRENLAGRGLWRVPSDGGQPVQFSQFDRRAGSVCNSRRVRRTHGRLVFYSSTRASTLDLKIGVVSTASGKTTVFTGLPGARVLGLADGFLLYVRIDGALMAAPFDVSSLRAGHRCRFSTASPRAAGCRPRRSRPMGRCSTSAAAWRASWCASTSTV